VANIPPDTPMTVALYGIRRFYDWRIIDEYWNSSIAELLKTNLQPNMYMVMMQLYRAGQALPASHGGRSPRGLSDLFCQFWLGPSLLFATGGEPPEAKVKREAVGAVGWIYHDVIETASNGNGGNGGPGDEGMGPGNGGNGGLTYSYAVGVGSKRIRAN
jgi:hypothetical protein